ncbi:hypothetical protein [Massilia sp. YIM B04103]|uniref:hypothetical protein n=1 Tax=Massilia sp. YIM B04103 TaxID=2963106 RepID=UPI00210D1346|nr:hypothetical protein [Massilia sp. YIM B04103]
MNKPLRINFELERADNPPLYDELARFPKGGRRVNRLRTLAHAGLLAQTAPALSDFPSTPTSKVSPETAAMSVASSELFGPSVDI